MDKELNPAVYVPGNCAAGQYGLKVAGPCSTTGNTQARRLFTQLNPSQGPFYGTTEYLDDSGTGSYNGLIRFGGTPALKPLLGAGELYVLALYCRFADDRAFRPGLHRSLRSRFDRGNCPYIDIHHNFNLSGVLQSPRYSSRALELIAGGWQLAPIVGWHSGSYFTVTTGLDDALTEIGAQRPNQVLSSPYCHPATVNCYINGKAFAQPASGTLGNTKANSLQAPGYVDVDISLSRRFAITERQGIEIRWETFNIANHTNLLNLVLPALRREGTNGTVLNSSTFGQLKSDVAPRIMQFAVKYIF